MTKILIADTPDFCEALAQTIRDYLLNRHSEMKFEMSTVHSPERAVKLIESQGPSWLFLALEFASAPSFGLNFLGFIKTISPQTKVIALTTDDKLETFEEAIRLGADECLSKPFALGQLHQILDNIVCNAN